MRILIKNTLLNGKTRDIYLNNGIIEEISIACGREADKIIDGKNKAALPSFINGHTHAAMTLFRGYADDMPLKNWLEEKIWVLESKLTEEDVYWGAKLGCLEMIKNGVTVFNDMYWHWEATAQATVETGIRGLISAVFIDMFDEKKGHEQIDHNIRLFELSKRYGPNVSFTLGPHAIYTVSEKSLRWARDFSEKHSLFVHMHLAETHEENHFTIEKYGCSPVEFLDRIGILSDKFIGCHGCVLNDADCRTLKARQAKLVHIPVSNLKLAVGKVFPHFLMRDKGIPYCFGTDGCASNNHLDIIETMKFAALLAKFSNHDPTMLPATETLDIATKVAAGIFNLGEWEIAVGNSPDIILIDLNRPEFVPNFDLASDIVYASNGSVVDTVICMGKVVMENRHVPDEEAILDNAKKAAKNLVAR